MFLRYYINYRQDDWTKWLATAEFQYNDKEYAATEHTLFYVNYGRYSWKGNLTVETEILLGGLDTQRRLNPKLGDCPRSKVIFE